VLSVSATVSAIKVSAIKAAMTNMTDG
jgi:hypothetical protein